MMRIMLKLKTIVPKGKLAAGPKRDKTIIKRVKSCNVHGM
jgi:hypothetical protein